MAEHRVQCCEDVMGNNLLIEELSDAVGFVGMVLVGIRGGLGLQLARGWRRSREEGGA